MSIKPKTIVVYKDSPPMIVRKIVGLEAICRWDDGFGSEHERLFPIHLLKKAPSSHA